jgi:hypothetical protein
MSECDEVAASIAAHVGLVTMAGLRSLADAERLAKLYLEDEGATIIANVATELLRIGRAKPVEGEKP